MIPFGSTDLPVDTAALARSLSAGLSRLVEPGTRPPAVEVNGTSGPHGRSIAVDLSGCVVRDVDPPVDPRPLGGRIELDRLRVCGEPVLVSGTQVSFDVDATDVDLELVELDGESWLLPDRVGEGTVIAAISKLELEKLLLVQARRAAAEKGIEIVDVEVDLASVGARAIEVRVVAAARKVVKAKVHLEATLTIDDHLDAVVTDVRARLGGFLKPVLSGAVGRAGDQLNGRRLPLTAVDLAGARLRDLDIDVSDGLRVEARLG